MSQRKIDCQIERDNPTHAPKSREIRLSRAKEKQNSSRIFSPPLRKPLNPIGVAGSRGRVESIETTAKYKLFCRALPNRTGPNLISSYRLERDRNGVITIAKQESSHFFHKPQGSRHHAKREKNASLFSRSSSNSE